MTKPELKSVEKASAEVVVPPNELEALRETVAIDDAAMAQLGRSYLEEARAQKSLANALETLKVARESALHAQRHRRQIHKAIFCSMEVDDGAWELDLEAGKLLRTDGKS